jgi:protease-4
MAQAKRGRVARLFFGFWSVLDVSRRVVLNLIFLIILIALIVGIFTGGPKPLQDKTALVLNWRGPIVEQNGADPRSLVARALQGDEDKSTQLRDILRALDAAGKDPQIGTAVLVLDEFSGAGLAVMREVAAALERFKASGKKIVAWGSSMDQRQYFLAAHANEVYLHPQGMVMIDGFGRYRNYYREALDKLGVTVNVIKVGTYKNFAETYVADGPSPASVESEAFVYNALWKVYTRDVEKARKLPEGSVAKGIEELPQNLASVGGDPAALAVKYKLVDALKTRDELREMMIARGAKDEQSKSFVQVSFDDYLARLKPSLTGDAVGVVVAQGDIVDGDAPVGTVGGLSTSALVRKAREDDSIKAIVLRVDSPGGSVFGSELVRRELELARAVGKPVVVSMGNVAASGGYWISTSSDEILADEATITGSIGVFGIIPTVDKTLDKLGVHTHGVTTTWLAGAGDPRRPLDPRFAAVMQSSIDRIYSQFTGKVAAARKTTPEEVDRVAQGRIWTGEQALERKLVDRLASYTEALDTAAKLGKLGAEHRVVYLERDPGKFERILKMFGDNAVTAMAQQAAMKMGWIAQPLPAVLPPAVLGEVKSDLGWLSDVQQRRNPFAAVTHCLCTAP